MLEEFLVSNIYAILLVFARIGSGLMVMAGFGESYVSPRVRLSIALLLALVVSPFVAESLPPIPTDPIILMILIIAEMMIGIAIGITCRFIISVMHVAGTIISFQSSLAMATQFDASQASQGTIIGALMGLTAVVLIFTTDMHYIMLRGLTDSYVMFPAGAFPPVEDFAEHFSRLLSSVFALGVKLAAPAIVVGLLLYLGAGILARLMPNMQVFFILMPPQILIGFFILMAVYTAIMFEFMDIYAEHLSTFLNGGSE